MLKCSKKCTVLGLDISTSITGASIIQNSNIIKNTTTEVPKKEKEEIIVFVNMGGHPLAQKKPDGTGYEGILYDSWKLIKENMKDKYTFKEIFEERTDYDQMTKDVKSGKYDMVIAHFQLTEDRMKIINFTNNLIISKNTILHLPKVDLGQQIKAIFKWTKIWMML